MNQPIQNNESYSTSCPFCAKPESRYRYDHGTHQHFYEWDSQSSSVTATAFHFDFWRAMERVARLHLANLVVC